MQVTSNTGSVSQEDGESICAYYTHIQKGNERNRILHPTAGSEEGNYTELSDRRGNITKRLKKWVRNHLPLIKT